MDYLQYFLKNSTLDFQKWVLNLIINGLPSILESLQLDSTTYGEVVLNLIINGLPSIRKE